MNANITDAIAWFLNTYPDFRLSLSADRISVNLHMEYRRYEHDSLIISKRITSDTVRAAEFDILQAELHNMAYHLNTKRFPETP